MKLIRHRIPDDMRARGYEPVLAKVAGDGLVRMLIEKLKEETAEVEACNGRDLNELADVQEVLYTLTLEAGFSLEELNAARLAKSRRCGVFAYGTVWVNDDDQSPLVLAASQAYAAEELRS